MKKHTRGFTLLELVATLVIVGVLVSVVIPRIISYTKEAREKACRANIGTINEQVELNYVRTGEWARGDLVDIARNPDLFPNMIPDCPVTGYNYWIYEDTHRVGGHIEGEPESHKELGISKYGDILLDSQAKLIAGISREFNVEFRDLTGDASITRFTNIEYSDENIISAELNLYDAFGNLVCTALASNVVWETYTVIEDGEEVVKYRVKSITFTYKDLYGTATHSLNKEYEGGRLVNASGAIYNEDQSVRAYMAITEDGIEYNEYGSIKKLTLEFTDTTTARNPVEYWDVERYFDANGNELAFRMTFEDGSENAKETTLRYGLINHPDNKRKAENHLLFNGAIEVNPDVPFNLENVAIANMHKIRGVNEAKDITYDVNSGRETGYTETKIRIVWIDGVPTLYEVDYKYSNYIYDSDGRRAGYTRNEMGVDDEGNEIVYKSIEVSENPGDVRGGGYQAASIIERGTDGIKTGSKEYSKYGYEKGLLTGFEMIDRDEVGNQEERQVYTAVAFDSLGRHTAYTQQNYDKNDQKADKISYTEVAFYKTGEPQREMVNVRTSSYKFATADSAGNFVEGYRITEIAYDARGNKAGYRWEKLDSSGNPTGVQGDQRDFPPGSVLR